jgi:Prohead core protein serine protease
MPTILFNGKPIDLLIESCDEFQFITEELNGHRFHLVEGIFLQQEIANKNKRKYSKSIMEPEVFRYTNEMVLQNRAVGELGHPDGPTINPERVSHKILSLVQDGNNFIGKARVSNSPFGKIVQNFLEEDIKFGVSSRGIGTLRRMNGIDMVQSDFRLATAADFVFDPSAPDAFVRGVMEDKEYILADGLIQEENLDKWKKAIKSASKNSLHEVTFTAYTEFLTNLDNQFKI